MNAISAVVDEEFHAEYDSVKFVIIFIMNDARILILCFGFEPKKKYSNSSIFYMEMF